jgi:arylsulfatase A-like enzyme
VPFLIRYPNGIPAGRVLADPFGTPDIYPTLAALAGVKAPNTLDGSDFSELFAAKTQTAPRDYVYMEMPYAYVPWPGWRAFRTKDHMYARTSERPWLLYDLAKDRWETDNLIGTNSEEVKACDSRLAAMMKQYGDSWSAKTDTGDVTAWLPGGPKQQSQNLGVPFPGQQKPSAEQLGAGKKGKKKKAAGDDDE